MTEQNEVSPAPSTNSSKKDFVTPEDLKKIVSDALMTSLNASVESKEAVQRFLEVIEPEMTAAINAGDSMSLQFLQDRIEGQLGRISMGLLYRQKDTAGAVVKAIVQTVVKLGFGIVVAA